jgi:UDP-2,3-diacylglucosamine hydrolase
VPRTLFISDLHLSQERPQEVALFARFLREHAAGASALYVLGDLFEYWIGDDALGEDPLGDEVVAGLRALANRGTRVRIMQGNRDFLLGEAFCAAAGAALLADPALESIESVPTLLLHGDTLCTDDTDYQAWRRTARSDAWQREFLSQPLQRRHGTMRALREQSAKAIVAKPAEVMDVNAAAVAGAFLRHGVRRMIHGHTHRPARHVHRLDGRDCERWVLPDWYVGGGFLVADAAGLRLEKL